MIVAVIWALVGHWRRNVLQLFTLVAGLALATALWSGVQAINAEAKASYDAAASTLGNGLFDRIVRQGDAPIAQSDYVALRKSGWLVSPVIEGQINGVQLIGIEPLTSPTILFRFEVVGQDTLLTMLGGTNTIFVHPDAADDLDWFGSVIIDPTLAPQTAIADIGHAQAMLGRTGEIDFLLVDPTQPLNQPALDDVAPELYLQTANSGTDIGQLTDSFHLNLTAFGMLSFLVGIFIVHGAIGLVFEQRKPTIRTLRALGVPLGDLLIVMIFELLTIALIAGAIGVVIGYFIAAALLPDVAATLKGLYGAEVNGSLSIRPSWWISGMLVALGGTMVASIGSIWRLTRLPLLAVTQSQAHVLAGGRAAKWQAVFALCLLVLAGILTVVSDSLLEGFTLLGAMLIGAALGLPFLLRVLLSFLEQLSNGSIAKWFWADTRAQLPGLSLALMALLLAMAANVGVSTMVSSFRMTFIGFLDQRLAAEFYVTTNTTDQRDRILALEAATVLPIQSADIQISGQPVEIYGNRDHATYRDNWQFLSALSDPWGQVANEEALIISEQLARRSGLAVGDSVNVGNRDLRVAGIYGDYGNPIGQAIISNLLFKAMFPDISPMRFGIRVAAEQVEEFKQEIEAIGIPDANILNQQSIKQFSLEIFDRTFVVTAALNVLTLAVAGFAMLMSLLTLSNMRVPQLAPAWAIGMTRSQLGQLELLRTLMLAVFTAVMSLPLGLALAWVLLEIVNVAAFGWRLPMSLFPMDYARLGIIALSAATLAASWPALRLARTPPSELLKVFSNER